MQQQMGVCRRLGDATRRGASPIADHVSLVEAMTIEQSNFGRLVLVLLLVPCFQLS